MSRTRLSCTACPARVHCHSGLMSLSQPELWTPGWDCLKEPIREQTSYNTALKDACRLYLEKYMNTIPQRNKHQCVCIHKGARLHSIKPMQLSS